MPTYTQGNLGLNKPNNGEFVDQWDNPVNANMDKIDTLVSYTYRSIINAINAAYTDSTPLDLNNNVIGTADALKQLIDSLLSAADLPDDLKFAKNDRFLGTQQSVFDVLAKLERYLYWLSQGNTDTDSDHPDKLTKEMARRSHHETNCLMSNVSGVSIGLASGKPVVQPTGVDPVDIDVEGRTYHIYRALESISGALGGSRGVAFIFAEPQEETIYSDGGSADGVFTQESVTNIWRKFTAASNPDFTNARPWHILRIASKTVGDFDIGGDYFIESIDVGEITIIGGVPAKVDEASVEGLTFEVIDPFAVKIDHVFEAHATTGYRQISPKFSDVSSKAFLGELHWNGATVDNTIVYATKGYYDTGWQSVAALATKPPDDPVITNLISHKIGPVFNQTKTADVWTVRPRVQVFVAQKDSDDYLTDIQEVPFNSRFSGSVAATEALQRGWAGYFNRDQGQIALGVKMPDGATPEFGVQRILDESSFLANDPTNVNAYITDPADSYYRVIISRR